MKRGSPQLRIRTKFIATLIATAVVPICLALLVFETLGYRSYRETLGQLQETQAKHSAMTLEHLVRQKLEGYPDVSVPIRDQHNPQALPQVVLKAVINASRFFTLVEPVSGGEALNRQVILEDGRILATLGEPTPEPLQERISERALKKVRSKGAGWVVEEFGGVEPELVGFAPLRISGIPPVGGEVGGATPMYVLVRQPASAALAPARRQTLWLGAAGGVCLLGFVGVGYAIATRELIGPIERLRETVHRVAGTVKLDRWGATSSATSEVLEPLRKIKSHDELEDLAKDIGRMAQRVLGYNEQLEREIAEKTAEISRDLQLAREFQEALMPHSFPKVPTDAHLSPLSLGFRHLYKPASSVGGDFFDVVKLDDQRAGVFIADVMGHGARSALVTAILRTLLQNLTAESSDPARFLATLNRHFHNILKNSGETIFVSAFYLVVDTQDATVRYAAAGHPSPFIANRGNGEVRQLFPHLHGNPALGLFANAEYQQWTLGVQAGDVFVLFTDGVHEAYNEAGDEFGLEQVRKVIQDQLHRPDTDIPAAIVTELKRFIAPSPPADDICIVALEVNAAAVPETMEPAPEGEVIGGRFPS
jgi:serine phosphatase RsbU (regulator of sigma subunit)